MHGTRKSKASVRGSTTDLVSAYDVNIVPGLGAVSTSNIIAGGRMRKGARANDDRSGQKGGEAPIDASLSTSKVRKMCRKRRESASRLCLLSERKQTKGNFCCHLLPPPGRRRHPLQRLWQLQAH